jgi:hypothetical protein
MALWGGLIRRSPGDAAFSEYVREKAGWCCERCRASFVHERAKLHCSHFLSRANPRVRFDEDNVMAACLWCHDFLGKNPNEHHELFRRRLGEERYSALMVRANARRSERVDHKFEAIRWRAALKDLRKRTQGKIIGARS